MTDSGELTLRLYCRASMIASHSSHHIFCMFVAAGGGMSVAVCFRQVCFPREYGDDKNARGNTYGRVARWNVLFVPISFPRRENLLALKAYIFCLLGVISPGLGLRRYVSGALSGIFTVSSNPVRMSILISILAL